jgi:hypothetical protein
MNDRRIRVQDVEPTLAYSWVYLNDRKLVSVQPAGPTETRKGSPYRAEIRRLAHEEKVLHWTIYGPSGILDEGMLSDWRDASGCEAAEVLLKQLDRVWRDVRLPGGDG